MATRKKVFLTWINKCETKKSEQKGQVETKNSQIRNRKRKWTNYENAKQNKTIDKIINSRKLRKRKTRNKENQNQREVYSFEWNEVYFIR